MKTRFAKLITEFLVKDKAVKQKKMKILRFCGRKTVLIWYREMVSKTVFFC